MARKKRPGITIEDQENQMINLAMSAAEERLRSGTATDSLVIHYLRLGTTKAALEREKLRNENRLLTAKTEAIENGKETERLYREAIESFKHYRIPEDDEEYYE